MVRGPVSRATPDRAAAPPGVDAWYTGAEVPTERAGLELGIDGGGEALPSIPRREQPPKVTLKLCLRQDQPSLTIELRSILFAAFEQLLNAKIEDADRPLNDLDGYPHAFVIVWVMIWQIKAERVWLSPLALAKKPGDFSMEILIRLPHAEGPLSPSFADIQCRVDALSTDLDRCCRYRPSEGPCRR